MRDQLGGFVVESVIVDRGVDGGCDFPIPLVVILQVKFIEKGGLLAPAANRIHPEIPPLTPRFFWSTPICVMAILR